MPAEGEPRVGDIVTRLLQIAGAGAAIVGWVAIVGGARVTARFEALGIPSPLNTVSALPRSLLLAEGLRALAVPLAVAAITAAGTFAFGRPRRPYNDRVEAAWRRADERFGHRFASDRRSQPELSNYELYAERKRQQQEAFDDEALVALALKGGVEGSVFGSWDRLRWHLRKLDGLEGVLVRLGFGGGLLVFLASFFLSKPADQFYLAVLGGGLALIAFMRGFAVIEHRSNLPRDVLFDQGTVSGGAVIGIAAVFIAGLFVGILSPLPPVPPLTAVAVLAVGLFVAMVRSFRHYGVAVLATFTAIVVIGGVAQLLRENVRDSIPLDCAEVVGKNGAVQNGFLLGRSADEVFLTFHDIAGFRVRILPDKEVREITVGPTAALGRGDAVDSSKSCPG
jgi:hypothetical protein